MTEQQAYEVLEKYPDFELRRYPDHLVAEIEVGGAFELAGKHRRSPGSPATSAVTTGPRARWP